MEANKDFTLTLLSNGSDQYFSNNTLTSFTNQLPQEIILNKDKDWCVSLQDIGIHLNYENFSISKENPIFLAFDAQDLLPIVGTKIEDLSSGQLLPSNVLTLCTKSKVVKNVHHISVETLHVSPQLFNLDLIAKKLHQFISNSKLLNDNLQFLVASNYINNIQLYAKEGNETNVKGLKEYAINNPSIDVVKVRQVYFKNISYTSNSQEKNNFPIALCIHSLLYEALQLKYKKNTTQIEINDQNYILVILNPSDIILSPHVLENEFPRLASNICHVFCNIVEPYQFNENYCQLIRTISLPRYNNYYFNTSKTSQFFKINKESLKQINIKLFTEDFELLPLLPGVASITKLRFKAMDKPRVSNLKVSSSSEKYSAFENRNSSFRVKIPSNLNFNQPNLHISVSSITFPNKFKTFPANSKNILYVLTINEQLQIEKVENITIPGRSFQSSRDLLYSINYQLSKAGISSFSFHSTHQLKDNFHPSNQYCLIKSTQSIIIVLPLHLSIILGVKKDFIGLNDKGEYFWGDVDISNRFYISPGMKMKAQQISKNMINLIKETLVEEKDLLKNGYFITLKGGDSYSFNHSLNIYEFKPKYFLLYNNICEHSIYDSKFLRILKIVPVRESLAEFMTIEFENEEYQKIQVSHPNYLEFTLRTHTGELVQFHDTKENVIIDLSFKIVN